MGSDPFPQERALTPLHRNHPRVAWIYYVVPDARHASMDRAGCWMGSDPFPQERALTPLRRNHPRLAWLYSCLSYCSLIPNALSVP